MSNTTFPCKSCFKQDQSCCKENTVMWTPMEVESLEKNFPELMGNINKFKAGYPFVSIRLISDEEIAESTIKACPFLDEEGSCKVYKSRPHLCKIFGEKKFLPCHYKGQTEETFEPMTEAERYDWVRKQPFGDFDQDWIDHNSVHTEKTRSTVEKLPELPFKHDLIPNFSGIEGLEE